MIQINDVSFTYAGGREESGLCHVDLNIRPGETVLLCGQSGCGKTTLTRLVNGLIPHYYEGELKGRVVVDGKNVPETELYELARSVGSVFQNPRSQFFNVDTTSELAFGCENLGMPGEEIVDRVERAVHALSLRPLLDRSIFGLSGGEKQRIACGSVSALEPGVVVLDEPTSNLDFQGIRALRGVVARWKEEGRTVLVAEHRLHFLKGLADRVILMEDGSIREEFDGTAFFEQPLEFFEERGLRIPSLDRLLLGRQIPGKEKGIYGNEIPLIGSSGKETAAKEAAAKETAAKEAAAKERIPLELDGFHFSYRKGTTTLDISRAELPGGIIAVIGENGAGKTTLARSICGLLKRDRSRILYQGEALGAKKRLSSCYMVLQDVNHQLFTESVMDEVLLSMKGEDEERAREILGALDLLAVKDSHPMSLSGGEKQRVAIASALASERKILIFDEPTSGLDLIHMRQTARRVRDLPGRGVTVLVVTHDPEFILSCCTHVLHMRQGRIVENYPLDENGIGNLADYFREGEGHVV